MVGVTHVATHRQAEKLAHEMIFETRPNNLPFVVQIFWPNESNHTIYQERIKCPRHPVSPGFKRQLIDAMVSFRRKRAALAGFEVHHTVSCPRHVSLLVMFKRL